MVLKAPELIQVILIHDTHQDIIIFAIEFMCAFKFR